MLTHYQKLQKKFQSILAVIYEFGCKLVGNNFEEVKTIILKLVFSFQLNRINMYGNQ
jgi:hypothetical protein